MSNLSFYPIGGSYWIVIVAALVLMGLLAVGPGNHRANRGQRAVLAIFRTAVILLIVLAMLRPTLVVSETKKHSATLILLLDGSRSMQVPDMAGGTSRWSVLKEVVDGASPALARLAEEFELKVYLFGAEAEPVEFRNGRVVLPKEPDGEQTAIGAVLDDTLVRKESGKRLLGAVLLSDGAQRARAPRDVAPQTIAAQLERLGCPLFTVAFGKSGGLGEAPDVAVKSLQVNPSVFVKNKLQVAGEVRIDGYRNKPVTVRLLFENASGGMKEETSVVLTPTSNDQLMPVRMSFPPQTPGEWKLTLKAANQRDELTANNNQLSTFVNVLKGGLNVLYIEGTYRVEQKFIRKALDASPDINVDYLRLDARDLSTRPGDMAARFEPGKYEVYILGDVDSSVFKPEELKALAEAVDQGAGLIMLGGFYSFGPGGYATTPLADVLPVQMDRLERQQIDDPISKDLHLPGPLRMMPTPIGLRHFALMLAGSREENQATWMKLPPLEGANRLRKKLAAIPLADAGANAPLLLAGNFGNGRVMALGVDSTWRWWLRGHESVHKQFWRQVVLWLAKKDQSTDGNVWITLQPRRYAPATRVDFTVGAQSATGDPVPNAKYEASVVLPDGTREQVALVRDEENMEGSFYNTQAAGDYAIEVTVVDQGLPLGATRARFLVFQQDLELDNAAADDASLRSLAEMTGGDSPKPEELSALIDRLAEQTDHLEVEQKTSKTYWDTWSFFLLLVGLLGCEWYLRKRWGLV